MTLKTFTIEVDAIKYGSLVLWEEAGVLYWVRDYCYVNANGEPVSTPNDDSNVIAGSVMSGEMSWSELPQNVQDALIQKIGRAHV